MERKRLTIALAGNPNAGKTTIFNAITGAHQHVGNWPGVTVEKKEGHTRYKDIDITVVDLPGTYSLTAYSIEEIVARKFVVHERPDVVVHIIDSSNLERNLFLTSQFIELQCPLVLCLNMFDALEEQGKKVDIDKLGMLLGAPAVPTIGTKGKGIEQLLDTILQVAEKKHPLSRTVNIRYGHELEDHIHPLTEKIAERRCFEIVHPDRWVAVKLLEGDEEIIGAMRNNEACRPLLDEVEAERDHLESIFGGDDTESVITERRYGFVAGVLREVYSEPAIDRVTLSDKIDKVLTHKVLGLPAFFLMIWLMFQLTFSVGAYPMDWIEAIVTRLSGFVAGVMTDGPLKDLLVEGVINGVGSVIIFLPNIFILFLFISFMEDSGYMARAAFLTDRVMHSLGLHGKSFIPMLMGFGCNAPAIMATRTLESERDRILTILINPLISCSARLPVYILIAGAFFSPKRAGTAVFSIYFLGLALAILMGKLFSKTILRGEAAPFVMELPPYRIPTVKSSMIHMWDRGKIFLRKMGGVILIGSVLIWFLGEYPKNVHYSHDFDAEIAKAQIALDALPETSDAFTVENRTQLEAAITTLDKAKEAERISHTFIGHIGHAIEPVVSPLGFDWKGGVALMTGFVAKEIVVSTLGVLYQVGEEATEGSEGLKQALRDSGMTPLVGYAFMVFVLIYTPCLGTLAAIKRETNSWKWTLFSVAYSLVLAWITAFIVVHGGRALGLG